MHPRLKKAKVISRCGNYLWCYSSEVPSEGVVNNTLEKGSGKVEAGACQRGPRGDRANLEILSYGDMDPLRKVKTPV